MKTDVNSNENCNEKDEKSFKFLTSLLIQFVLVCLNLVAGFVTDSLSLTASVGYHLATIFLIGDDVARNVFPDTNAAKLGRLVILIFDSVMVLAFSVIVANEFFNRVSSPVSFSEPEQWMMFGTSIIATTLAIVYVSNQVKPWKEVFVPAEVLVSMVLLKIFEYELIDSYVGLAVSLFAIYLAIKMIVRAWGHRKNF